MVNENSGVVGILADTIAPMRSKVFGAEGIMTDFNVLGMVRPLAQIKLAETLAEQGGILSALDTGSKKMTAARKGGGTGAVRNPVKRYRPTTPPATPPVQTAQVIDQPEEVEIIL